MSDIYLMLFVFSPFIGVILIWSWMKYTDWQIEKQHNDRQDDE